MQNNTDDKLFRVAEGKLFDYNSKTIRIQALTLENEILENEISNYKSQIYSDEVVSSSFNKKEILDLIIQRQDKMNRNIREMSNLDKEIKKIDNAMQLLSDADKEIVKLRYFQSRNWNEVSKNALYSISSCKRKRVEIINKIKEIV